MLHTSDGGKTWIRQGSAALFPAKGFIDGDASDVNTAFLLAPPDGTGESFFYMTLDGGTTWEDRSPVIQPENSKLDSTAIHFIPIPVTVP